MSEPTCPDCGGDLFGALTCPCWDEDDSGECQKCHGWWGHVVLPGGALGSRYTCDCGEERRYES